MLYTPEQTRQAAQFTLSTSDYTYSTWYCLYRPMGGQGQVPTQTPQSHHVTLSPLSAELVGGIK